MFDFIKSSAADVVKQLPAQIKLDETFNAQGEYKDQLRVLTNLIEPAIIITMAVGVGFLLFSVVSAMFSITQGITR